jgi:hypothetical protein
MARRLGRLLLLPFAWCAANGCETIAGYDDVEPWPPDAGSQNDTAPPDTSSESDATGDPDTGELDSPVDSPNEPPIDAPKDVDSGPCPVLGGGDACARVSKFTAATQVLDGAGDEFCDVPAMEFEVNGCPTMLPAEPPTLPERVFLRIAWSTDAFHFHVHVVDPSVVVNPNAGDLYDGDSVEIYVAGASGDKLTGSYDGTNDGGAIQIVLAPPGAGFPTRGQAFFNPGNGAHTNAPISPSIFAGRLVADGYEIELRFPWVAFAEPAVPGNKIGFDFAINAQVNSDAGGRELQCIISDVFVDGEAACGYPSGTPAQPWCDDRAWCQPVLQP